MEDTSNRKRNLSKRALIFRIIFIIIYIIILYFLYIFLIDLGIQHWIIIIILIFLILIVIGPLITGISKAMYYRLFPKKEKKTKSDFQLYKEQLKSKPQKNDLSPMDAKSIDLGFKYKKPIIRKCTNCGIIIPNFVKICPNCGKPISD